MQTEQNCEGVIPVVISQSQLFSGIMYFGTALENITPVVADTWAFRGKMIVSPGEQVAKIDAWTPQLVLPTRNHVSLAPKSSVSCLFASRRGPTWESENQYH
ncbi:Uncharacterized protein Fot_43042 [Forsythia ovata]|uniref:Uncharacterized protein n=1 Tax=Forsythia ovata TaxID=205694 RepID=A0ABD1RMX2_9LAMI